MLVSIQPFLLWNPMIKLSAVLGPPGPSYSDIAGEMAAELELEWRTCSLHKAVSCSAAIE
jgi:hypothetical protein